MDFDQILAMPSSRLTLLGSYFLLEPFGPIRDNYHAALSLAQGLNLRRQKASDPVVSHEVFMYGRKPAKNQETHQDFITALSQEVKKLNG